MITTASVDLNPDPAEPRPDSLVTWASMQEGAQAVFISYCMQAYGRGPFKVVSSRKQGERWFVKLGNSTGVLQHKNVPRPRVGAEREFDWGYLRLV